MITSIWTSPGGDASAAQELRREVFQHELGFSTAEDQDGQDAYAWHLVLLLNEEPVATGRITYGGVGTAKLSRICVKKRYRRQGIGDGLVKILDFKASQMGMRYSAVEVPEDLMGFYTRLGYTATGETYVKLGRKLTPMKKETNDGSRENCSHQCSGKKG